MDSTEKLKSEIAVLKGILKEKQDALRIAEAIEKQKEEMWKRHVTEVSEEVQREG